MVPARAAGAGAAAAFTAALDDAGDFGDGAGDDGREAAEGRLELSGFEVQPAANATTVTDKSSVFTIR